MVPEQWFLYHNSLYLSELYIDTKKQTYAAIGYKRYSLWSVLAAVFSKKAREALAKVILFYLSS